MARQGGIVNVARKAAGGALARAAQRAVPGEVIVPGQNAGWSTPRGWGAIGNHGTARVRSPLNVYGGTDESVVWVYACITLRAQSLAAYPWWLHKPSKPEQHYDRPGPSPSRSGDARALYGLLDEPNADEHTTYFDFVEGVITDLDLTGNSFWLLDQQNGIGQPDEILRLPPGTVKVVVNSQDRRVGYVHEPKGDGRKIPLGLRDVMHFRYPNPLQRHYGMGVVEALIRSIDGELSQSEHVTAFFTQGAHLSGVLTVPDTVSEDDFNRMKQQYEQEFQNSNNSFRVLIAEGAQSYTPISATPSGLGIVDLRRYSKDEILSGFGVPEFILGGTGQGGVYKMEEAQNIFYRTMIPLARRVGRRIDVDVAARYRCGFMIDPRQSDTQSSKVERARKLVGTGATVDDMREEAGLERLNMKGVTDLPAVPSGLVLLDKDSLPGQPAGGNAPPPQPQAEPDPNDEPGGDGDANDPAADGDTDEQKLLDPAPVAELPLAPAFEQKDAPRSVPVSVPPLPEGFEQRAKVGTLVAASVDHAGAALELQARELQRGVPLARAMFVAHFLGQRNRVISELGKYGSVTGAKLSAKPTHRKEALADADVVALAAENEALMAAHFELVDELGTTSFHGALGVLGVLDSTTDRGPQTMRVALLESVKQVNATTKALVEDEVREGLRRGYSVPQIVNGFDSEGFRGVVGIFDEAVDLRSSVLGRSHTARVHALAALTAYEKAGVEQVEVVDAGCGWSAPDDDDAAAGSVRSVEDAMAHLLAHPACARAFIPIR